jgi:M6 family metalloprotease-like protein
MKKITQLVLAFLIFIPAAASAMPPHPKLMNKWKSEGTVDANLAVLTQMKAMGIDKPVKSFPHTGSRNVLIILMNFADRPMNPVSDTTFYSELFNGGGSTTLTWKKYYSDMSASALPAPLNLTFTIVGPYNASHNYDYYGGGDATVPPVSINNPWDMIPPLTVVFGMALLLLFARKTKRLAPALASLVVLPVVLILAPSCGGGGGTITSPTKAPQLVREAVDNAEVHGVNFANFDNNSDGYVDSVIVIHQGPGEEVTGFPSDIWSHQWNLSAQNLQVKHDGVTINDYAMMPEYFSSPGDTTIGVFCHEFGHILGLPDLYDTTYTTAGVGDWSLMASGSWNGPSGDGEVPAPLLAWERHYLGWVTYVAPAATTNIDDINTSFQAVKIPLHTESFNPSYSQYLLVENIVNTPGSWTEHLPGSGLLITKIDDWWIYRNFNSNTINGAVSTTNNYFYIHGVNVIQSGGSTLWTGSGGGSTDTFCSDNSSASLEYSASTPYYLYPNTNYTVYTNSLSLPLNGYTGNPGGVTLSAFSARGPTMTFTYAP